MISPACLRRSVLASPVLALALVMVLGAVNGASAQGSNPRIGLSVDKDTYVDQITVLHDTEFTLYAMVFGVADGVPLNQPLIQIPWVIHQVCCGAVLEIMALEFNPALEHTGFPLAGTVSIAPTCLETDSIWLATLTVRLSSNVAGDFEWAAGPFGPVLDCSAESQFMSGLAVTVTMDENATPNETSAWGEIKSMYR